MQATQNWSGFDLSSRLAGRKGGAFGKIIGNLLVNALMRTRRIEVIQIFLNDPNQMAPVQNLHMIQAFPSQATDKPFAKRIGFGLLDRGAKHFNPPGCG